MKKIILFFVLYFSLQNNFAQIITSTVQITNPAPCTSCCNGVITADSIVCPCMPGPPVTLALITPTSVPPYNFGPVTTWMNLCNGVYTVAVNFMGACPQQTSCNPSFVCTVGYMLPTKISENSRSAENITLFPNPANDIVNLKINNLVNDKFIKIEIINSVGQTVKTESLTLKNEIASIRTDDLKIGIYYLRISKSNELNSLKRLVIVR